MYVKLINEGSVAYQSVPSSKFSSNIYKLEGSDIYDIEDEIWEFLVAYLGRGMHLKIERQEVIIVFLWGAEQVAKE